MIKKTFVLVSLEDSKSKEIANAISNQTAKKILDYLSNKEEASASQVSKELNIPLATTEYNLNMLLKAGLLESPEFKWSKKGKKVDLYKVARKLIVIAPKGTENLASKLTGLLPGVIMTFVGSFILYFTTKKQNLQMSESVFEEVPSMAMKAADNLVVQQAAGNQLYYFMFGASLAIVSIGLYSLYAYWRSRK